ncbi:MAG: radical SAM protein, partial [Thermodesulfobacteriota bacterium]
ELGLQSANDDTLKEMNRGHMAADFATAIRRCKTRKIPVCAHVILGLPNETEKDMFRTMEFLSGLGVWGVKFHQLQIMGDPPL